MLTHSQIWTAIDTLAQRHGLTPSALAKRAGLDATTFNRSKRQGADGHPRWPSTESIAKILAATGVGVDEFLAIITSEPGPSHLPFQFADHLTADAFDDEGRPQGAGWDRIEPLQGLRGDAFAIGLACDRFAPAYKQGDMIIASPSAPRRSRAAPRDGWQPDDWRTRARNGHAVAPARPFGRGTACAQDEGYPPARPHPLAQPVMPRVRRKASCAATSSPAIALRMSATVFSMP